LIRLLKQEVEVTNLDTKRVNLTIEKEDELINNKVNEEKRIVKMVGDDVKDQIRSLEEAIGFS